MLRKSYLLSQNITENAQEEDGNDMLQDINDKNPELPEGMYTDSRILS